VHTIRIEDDNDNAPYFTQDVFEFCVPENSKPGKNYLNRQTQLPLFMSVTYWYD